MSPSPQPTSSGPAVRSTSLTDAVQLGVDESSSRLVAAARDAAATDAATAAAADHDGCHGATDHLSRLLSTLPLVEQARGLLIGYFGIDADAAFDLLVRWSQSTNTKLTGLSDALLIAASTTRPGDEPFSGVRTFVATVGSTNPRVDPEPKPARPALSARPLRSTGRPGTTHVTGSRTSSVPAPRLVPSTTGLHGGAEASAGE